MPPPPAMSDGEPDAEAEPEAEPVELPPWSVAVVVVNGDPGDGSTEPLLDAAMGGFAEEGDLHSYFSPSSQIQSTAVEVVELAPQNQQRLL